MKRTKFGFWHGFLDGLGLGATWRLIARLWASKGGGNG
jgi:hypothetical protein